MNSSNEKKEYHLGRKVQRLRELTGIKQTSLSRLTGFSQQYISKLEQSVYIPEEILEKLATGLGLTADLIKHFDEERAILSIQNNFFFQEANANSQGTSELEQFDRALLLFDRILANKRKSIATEQKKADSISRGKKELTDLLKKVQGQENLKKRLSSKNPNMSTTETLSPNEKIIHWGYSVKKVREGQGLTTGYLAGKTNLSEARILELESTQNIPTDILQALAEAMGVKVELIKAFGELTIGKNSQHNLGGNNYQNNHSTVHYDVPSIIMDIIDKYIVGKKEPEQKNEETSAGTK
jgi:transcriptional regulator with XRE-family HTH domain